MKLPDKIKQSVERFPALAFAYRTLRDAWLFQRQRVELTPYGFRLMGNRAMQTGNFEREETALIEKMLVNVDVFVDVGANIGFYTCLARSKGVYTIAVEPLTQNMDYLYANLYANDWNDVEVYPVGLARKPGLANLYGVGTGASLLEGWDGASPSLRRTIALSTLDIVLGERFVGKKLLVKVDVEGAEYELLQGASSTLSLTPAPIWIVEIGLAEHHPSGFNRNYASTFDVFWKYGYESWTANNLRQFVTPASIEECVRLLKTRFGTHNYLFIKE